MPMSTIHTPTELTRKPFAKTAKGAIAGLGSLTALLLMSVNIGGFDRLPDIIRELCGPFLLIAIIASATASYLGKFDAFWTFAGGLVMGFLGGFLILLYIVSNI